MNKKKVEINGKLDKIMIRNLSYPILLITIVLISISKKDLISLTLELRALCLNICVFERVFEL